MQEKKSAGERIRDKKISLDADKVKAFFDARCQKELPYLYNYTYYEDNNPALALECDHTEKSRIALMLKVECEELVLVIGCGVVRWGEETAAHHAGRGLYGGDEYRQAILQLANERA